MNELSEDDVRIKGYAYHEAGHAIAHYHFKHRLLLVSITEQGDGKGGVTKAAGLNHEILRRRGVFWENTPEQLRYLSDHVIMNLAGEVAQTQYCPESVESYHSTYDRIAAKRRIKKAVPIPIEGEREAMLEELFQETRKLLEQPKYAAAVQALAQAVIEAKELSGDQATDIIRDAMRKANSK